MSIAKLSIAAALLSATTLSAQAQQSQTPEEVAATAQAQIESHASPAPTLNMLKECIDAYPKAPNIGKLYMLSGACMLASGNYDEAEEYLRMPQAAKISETTYWLGELAMARYDFTTARKEFQKYKDSCNKRGDEAGAETGADGIRRAVLGEDMISGRVEKIEIIDVATLPFEKFACLMRMSAPSGQLVDASALGNMGDTWNSINLDGPVYISEDGNVVYAAGTADDTAKRLYEGFRLTDGTWSDPRPLFDDDVDASYPFMLSDGCTFYFASRSEDGLGGYDIFRSNRDNDDGTFQNPVNMGMPYNSPADDYMLAIDEETGYGWWATDRNHLFDTDGQKLVSIYMFIPAETRVNYDADTEDLEFFASLHFDDAQESLKRTLKEDKDYSQILEAISNIPENRKKLQPQFTYVAPSGRIYTRYSELPERARPLMQRYQAASARLAKEARTLDSLYEEYRENGTSSLKSRIASAEIEVEQLRKAVLKELAAVDESLNNL